MVENVSIWLKYAKGVVRKKEKYSGQIGTEKWLKGKEICEK